MTRPLPSDDVIIGEHYYILASGVAADLPKLVLKHDEAFAVADRRGDVPNLPGGEFGFYVDGTRFLRQLELRLHGQRVLTLNAGTSEDGLQAAVDLTNPDVALSPHVLLSGRSLRIARRLFLSGTDFYQTLSVESYTPERHEVVLTLSYSADFVDVFEVRGHPRERRGETLPARREGAAMVLGYRGLDGVVRLTRLGFDPPPRHLDERMAEYRMVLAPRARVELTLVVSAQTGEPAPPPPPPAAEAAQRRRATVARLRAEAARVRSDHDLFNQWVDRSRRDLHLLLTETAMGFVPYAGIPWYVAPFGRDAVITALQVLPFEPEIAAGTLRFLTRYMGAADDPFTEEEPGRIMHEYRRGEMAACREIPFLPYYGSVDATPLYVMLVAEYLRWTGDLDLARTLWPAVERALAWMARTADAHGGHLAYARRSPLGLVNQGWKDSHDAVMHADGTLAEPPIALVEVQGYHYAALLAAAEVAAALGRGGEPLRERAAAVRERVETDFWLGDDGYYALALDRARRPCRVVTSNPGHLLWTGLPGQPRAELVARRLMADDTFTGWGLRTLAGGEQLYNPMSYHNGSVWPHDTAIAAVGMRRYGFADPFITLA
ncbi:MAG TPA: glycogen debranching N-terminal domain-containing protein, partial [Methylomirabilota bacterium]|nr:glycogen debranching N-terminal domain-containing protein [Methylomirabilota bacterium]